MDLGIRKETFHPAEDHTWLGSAHATDTADPITLDAALFTATFTQGFVPSGVVVGRVTATGKYGRYDNAALDGREVARGHLLTTVALKEGATNVSAALLRHGQVVEANLPANHGLEAAAKADLAGFLYV